VVKRAEPAALAGAIVEFLSHRRRTRPSSDEVLAREFSREVTAARFAAIYKDVVSGGGSRS
jgi:glycosyltransferase involved in cell wall biosynthesis